MYKHGIELTIQDIYFLTRLPPLGVVGDIHPVLPHGRNIVEFVDRHCGLGAHAKGTTIMISDLERLETRDVVATVLQILGSHEFNHITWRHMMLVESVLRGTYYGCVQMMLSSVKLNVSLCR